MMFPNMLALSKNENIEKASLNFSRLSVSYRLCAQCLLPWKQVTVHMQAHRVCGLWTQPLGAPLQNFLCLEILCNKAPGVTY